MSALFDFKSFLVTLLLFICTCTYVKMKAPQLMDSHRTGLRGLFWKAARVGERLSPWVAASCLVMGAHMFWTGGGQSTSSAPRDRTRLRLIAHRLPRQTPATNAASGHAN